jgi:hypothetical protein
VKILQTDGSDLPNHLSWAITQAPSGTSVGALNGAIWCADRMGIGEKMWSSMAATAAAL